MAVRPVIVLLGDKTAQGDRPVSELAAINSSYDDAQSEFVIWNDVAAAWQPMQAGVNTNPGTDRWSYEVRLRESLRTWKPTGILYCIKHALDSTLAHTSAKPSWSPSVTGSAFAGLITKITAAAAAANAVGDSLRIEWAICSIITDDFLSQATSTPYGRNLESLAVALRAAIAAIPFCAIGSITGGGATPVTFVEPHYQWAGLTHAEQYRLLFHRAQVQRLAFLEFNGFSVVPTHGQTVAADNKTFSAASMVAIGEMLPKAVFPSTPSDASTSIAPVVAILGDSIFEGTGVNVAIPGFQDVGLPAHLVGALQGVNIWQWKSGTVGSLQVGTNNLVSLDQGAGLHGLEPYLGELTRSLWGEAWIIKGTSVGVSSDLWNPFTESFFYDGMIRGWFSGLIDTIRRQNKKPSMRLVAICLGTNDILAINRLMEDLQLSVKSLMANIKRLLTVLNVDQTQLRFVLALPRSDMNAAASRIAEARALLQAIPETNPDVRLVDLDLFESFDKIHLTAKGLDDAAQAVFDAYRGTTNYLAVEPLFYPTLNELRKALRLSAAPTDSDSFAQISAAVQFVRISMTQHLGDSKVQSLRDMPFNPNPRTQGEHLRMLAAQTELKWVRSQLLRTMPTLFMDGTSKIQSWETDAAFRETSYLQTKDELRRLEEEIFEALGTLKSSVLAADGKISIATVGPTSSAAPGDSLFGTI